MSSDVTFLQDGQPAPSVVPPEDPSRRIKLTITMEFDPVVFGSGYAIDANPNFPNDVAIAILEKIQSRFVAAQLMAEMKMMAAAQQQQIVPAATMPPVPPHRRINGRR